MPTTAVAWRLDGAVLAILCDFRDRLCRKFAAEVEARTKGTLAFEIHADASLMKPVAQFSALRRGALDMSLYPLAYAGTEVKELNIGRQVAARW